MLSAIAILLATAVPVNPSPPADAEILRALPKVAPGVPLVFEESRDDVVVVKSLLKHGNVGPRVLVPLIGPAQLTEAHWECATYYRQTVQIGFPFPITVKKDRVSVVYIDNQALTFAGK